MTEQERKARHRNYARKYREANRERCRESARLSARKFRANNPNYYEVKGKPYKVQARKRYKETRLECIRQYGNKCACCGEHTTEFLTVDHINNDGAAHRKAIKGSIYFWLKRNNYPTDNFRLLCYNCNCSRGFLGYCPHERLLRANEMFEFD